MKPLSAFYWFIVLAVLAPISGWAQELTLTDAYQRALENDARLQIIKFQRDASEAQLDQAGALMYPSLSMFSQYSKNNVEFENDFADPRRYDGLRYGVSLSQRVFDYSVYSQIQGATSRKEVAIYTLDDETQLLGVRVAQAYFDVVAAQGEFLALGDEWQALKEQAKQVDALAARQLISTTEQLEVGARRDLIETRYIDAENSLALAKESLYMLTGARDWLPAEFNQAFVPFQVSQSLEEIVDQVLQENSQIKALEAQRQSARTFIDQAWGSVLPTVSLVATQQYSDIGFDNTTSPPRDTSYIGLNVNWTLIEGGAARARAREAWANYYAANERLKQIKQDIERELRSAWLEINASEKRAQAAKRALTSAELSLEAAVQSQKLGVGRVVDVMLSQSALTRAKVNVVNATVANAMAWIRLAYIRGELNVDTLDAIQARL